MNSQESTDRNAPGQDELLESLFRHADSRPRPPAGMEQEVRQAVEAQWRSLTRASRTRRRLVAMGMAAALLLAVFVAVNQPPPPAFDAGQALAAVEQGSGAIMVRGMDDPGQAFTPLQGGSLHAGTVIRTGDSARLGLNWRDGTSIRVAANTELVMVSGELLELADGRIYVDSGVEAATEGSFVIRTAAGDVQHLGTQYQAALLNGSLSVSVREGQVRVGDGKVDRGQKITIDNAGQSTVSTVPTFGDAWSWAEQVTPAMKLDGLSAFEFIAWAARQSGRSVVYDRDDTERTARHTDLRGSVRLDPGRALELILQTSDLQHQVVNGEIHVRMRS